MLPYLFGIACNNFLIILVAWLQEKKEAGGLSLQKGFPSLNCCCYAELLIREEGRVCSAVIFSFF